MNTHHPIKKKHGPVPHDPRNEPLPQREKESRSKEGAEKQVRKEEGVDMKGAGDKLPTGKGANDLDQETTVSEDEYGMPTGIQTGQTTRGSYSTDPSTGAGRYADHRSGKFGTEDVAQPGNDQSLEPDPIDPKLQR